MWGRPGVSFAGSDVTIVSSTARASVIATFSIQQPSFTYSKTRFEIRDFLPVHNQQFKHEARRRTVTRLSDMEPTAAGILYAAQDVLSGAAALVKGITHPTQPIRANLTRIASVPLPRSQHTVSIVKGRAYVFGKTMPLDSKSSKSNS